MTGHVVLFYVKVMVALCRRGGKATGHCDTFSFDLLVT